MSFTYVSKELIKEEIGRFKSIRPDNAEIVITSAQKGFFGFLFALGLFLGMVHFMEIFIALVGTCVVVFSILFSMKSLLTFVSLKKGLLEITKEELEGLKDEDLPVYTVLIPLRGEASVFHQLVDHLSAIDYPVEKLQVLILLEENDPSTVAAAKSIKLPSNFEVLVLADEGPRTKPKACTLALKYARGEFIVVYDAEDEMEPDQLKKVICAYQNLPEKVWCIQATQPQPKLTNKALCW